jgi:hypothetical protein
MISASRTPMDRPVSIRPIGDAHDDSSEMQRLRTDLARMRMYALTLEDRCHRLWSAIPDSDGHRDPMVPYLALHVSMAVPDAATPE